MFRSGNLITIVCIFITESLDFETAKLLKLAWIIADTTRHKMLNLTLLVGLVWISGATMDINSQECAYSASQKNPPPP